VTPSVTSSNFDEGLGVPPRTTSLAIEQTLKVQNPNTKYVELDSNGWVLLDVTPERVQGEWFFVDTVRTPAPGQRLDATWQVRRGAQRLSAGGPQTADRPARPAAPPAQQAPAAPRRRPARGQPAGSLGARRQRRRAPGGSRRPARSRSVSPRWPPWRPPAFVRRRGGR
jgi:hypothetical protein